MQVRQGFSGEVAPNEWAKADITVDEDDLRRLLRAAGLPFDDAGRIALDTAMVYQLLEIEAEFLLTVKLITRYNFDGRARLATLQTNRTKIINGLRGG